MAVESEVASVCVRVLQLMVGGAATSGKECEWVGDTTTTVRVGVGRITRSIQRNADSETQTAR